MSSMIWQWTPNWRSPVIERLEWLTGVLSSKNLTEQSIRMRNRPRTTLEFEVTVAARARRSFEAAVFVNQAGEWLLPIWMDGTFLDADLAQGSTSIPVDTTYRDYHAGGQAVLISGNTAEAVTISAVQAGQIDLLSGTLYAYPRGGRLYPARTARLVGGVQTITHLTGDLATARYRLQLTDPVDHAGVTPATYRGLPVLEHRPNWRDDRGARYRRELATLDYGASLPYVEDRAGRPEIVNTHLWTLGTRADIDSLRGWLYSLAGRQGALWLPTWMQDIKLAQPLGATDTVMDVEHCGYTANLLGQFNRRDIEIELAGGSVFRRRITNASVLDADTERLVIDADLGQAVSVAEVVRISYLQTARLESDAAELSWQTDSLAELAQELRVVNDDV